MNSFSFVHTYPKDFSAVRHLPLVVFVILAIANLFSLADNLLPRMIVEAPLVLYVLLFLNMYPEIITREDGLLIGFFLWRLRVKWEDIDNVELYRPLPFQIFLRDDKIKVYVVRAKSLTFFHRLYDTRSTFSPAFYFCSDIAGFENLLSSIQNKKLIQSSEKLAA